MAGLTRPKTYDWKDSNLALFGSDVEKQIKKESSKHEAAWKNAGTKVGLQIWRIVNFKVVSWPQTDYGKFFTGDSYIILNTYKPTPTSNAFAFDVHFWIGSQSTADEYGTAAYKTVELDTYLDDVPVQHREVQGHESDLFHSYFPKGITTMDGGAESGFHHVAAHLYQPRLFHFSGNTRKNIVIREVPLSRSRLDSGDVFVLDLGLNLYQWNGSGSNMNERHQAMEFLIKLKDERGGKTHSETIDEDSTPPDDPFYKAFDRKDVEDVAKRIHSTLTAKQELFKVSDATGRLQFSKKKEGSVTIRDFDSNDVFILDTGKNCIVWVGRRASDAEKKNGFGYAHKHLMATSHPLVPIIIVKEGQANSVFMTAVAA